MLAQLLKAVEAGAAGAGEDGDLSKMFMGMMEHPRLRLKPLHILRRNLATVLIFLNPRPKLDIQLLDMLAQLLKAVEAGAAGAGEDGDLSKMFMGMMEQLA
jgi:hypothetical protein